MKQIWGFFYMTEPLKHGTTRSLLDTFSYILDVICGDLLCMANEVSLLEIKRVLVYFPL